MEERNILPLPGLELVLLGTTSALIEAIAT
jgi:hypothetical protein